MKLYHVVAMARNRVIGKDNRLPWHFCADLKHFKQLTMGSTILMGRKTFESIGKPLPGRENFVLSRSRKNAEVNPHLKFFGSLEEALSNVQTSKAFIAGGAEIFVQTFDKIDGIYLTSIDQDYEGDTFYPEIPAAFQEKSRTRLQDNPRTEVIYLERQE